MCRYTHFDAINCSLLVIDNNRVQVFPENDLHSGVVLLLRRFAKIHHSTMDAYTQQPVSVRWTSQEAEGLTWEMLLQLHDGILQFGLLVTLHSVSLCVDEFVICILKFLVDFRFELTGSSPNQ